MAFKVHAKFKALQHICIYNSNKSFILSQIKDINMQKYLINIERHGHANSLVSSEEPFALIKSQFESLQ